MTQQVVNPLLIKPTPSPFQYGSSVAGDIVRKVNAWRDRIERVELHLGNACGRRKRPRPGDTALCRNDRIVSRVACTEIERQPPGDRPSVVRVDAEVADVSLRGHRTVEEIDLRRSAVVEDELIITRRPAIRRSVDRPQR